MIARGHDRWVFFTSSKMKIKGSRQAVVMTNNEFTAQLEPGDFFVHLRSVDEIKEIVSGTACRYFVRISKRSLIYLKRKYRNV